MTTMTREFYCDLTDEDIVERSTEQNQLLYDIAHLEAKRRDINAEIKPKNERVDELMHIIRNRKEKRNVECVWSYDWQRGIKSLIRTDTGEVIETDTIKDHERQKELPIAAASTGPFLFSNHPRCAYVLSGNKCASILCGHLPPVSVKGHSCPHPLEHHIIESNATTCGICHKVLKKADITRQLQPAEIPDSIALADPADEQPANIAEEAAIAKRNRERQIDKDRKCCYPGDRDIKMEGDIRIIYCRVCGLIAKKEDYSDLSNVKPVSFIVGERVDLGQVAA